MTLVRTFMKTGLKEKIQNNLQYPLYALIVLLPWQARYIAKQGYLGGAEWEYATLSVYAVDVFFVILLLISFLFHDRVQIQKYKKGISIVLALTAYILFSLVFSPYENTHVVGLLRIFITLTVILSLFFITWRRKYIFIALSAAGIWAGAFGACQFFFGEVFGNTLLGISSQHPLTQGVSVLEVEGLRLLRAYGSLSHPNILGGLLATSILSTVALLGMYTKRVIRICILFMLALQSFFLVITFSRSAFLGLIAGLLVAGLVILYKKKIFDLQYVSSFLTIIVVLSASAIIFSNEIQSRFSGNRLEGISVIERVESIDSVKNLFSSHYFLGTGFNTYTEALAEADESMQPAWTYQPVHNIDLLLLVELGIVGAILLTFTFVFYIRNVFKKTFTDERIFHVSILIALGVIAIFDHYLVSSHFGLLLVSVVFSLSKDD